MQKIKSKDTIPELKIRKLVYSMGYRYRLHLKSIPGTPDLVFLSKKKAIFVNGCFWHQHVGCKDSHIPKSNTGYWKPKLEKTIKRDIKYHETLFLNGWDTLVIWDCQMANEDLLKNRIKNFLDSSSNYLKVR